MDLSFYFGKAPSLQPAKTLWSPASDDDDTTVCTRSRGERSMSRPTRPADDTRRGSFGPLALFLFGVPLGVGLLVWIARTPSVGPELKRYFEHPVEQTEVVLFCCGMCALVA